MTAAVPLEDVEEALATCDVCQEPFDAESRVPLTLTPCRHVFCRACVTTLATPSALRCPKCRTTVDLGTGGVEGLSKDRVTMNAVDYIAMKKKMQTSGISCTGCPDGAKAVFRCHTCHTHLCTKCHEAHTRITVTRNHRTVDLGVFMKSMDNFVKEKESCPTHPDKDIEIYCKTCLVSACTLCGMVEHQRHDVCYFEEAYKQTVNRNTSLRTQLSLRKNRIVELKEEQLQLLQTLRTTTVKVKQDILKRFTTLKVLLVDRRSKLTQACDDLLKMEEKSVEQSLEKLKVREALLEERMTILERIQRSTRPAQFVSVHCTVSHPGAKLLCSKNPQLYVPIDFHFDPEGCQAVSSAIKTMGDFARAGETSVCRPFHIDLEQLLRLQSNQVTRFNLEDGSVAFACVQHPGQAIYIGKANAETGQNDVRMVPCTKMELSVENLNTTECHTRNATTLVNQPAPGSFHPSRHGMLSHNAYPGTSSTVVLQAASGVYFEFHLFAILVGNSVDLVFAEIALSPLGTRSEGEIVCRKNGWGMEFAMSQNQGGKMLVYGMSRGTCLQLTPISDFPMRADVVTRADVGLLLRYNVMTVFDVVRHQLLFQIQVGNTDMELWFGFFSRAQFDSKLTVVSGKDVKFDAKKLQMLSSVL